MPEEVTRLRVFVASPGDVLDERERLRLVVDELNRILADSLGRSLELLDWRDVVPSMGRPEDVILDQLKLDAWDIFVGILWTRFGSPTGGIHPETGAPFLSGTEEEFTLAYHSWQKTKRPRILFYRCMRSPQLDKLDASQFQRVQQFFVQFEAEGEHPGLYQPYKTLEEFERRVRNDLMRLILSYGEQLPDERQTMLKTQISRLERQPLHVPFANREDEIELILSSSAPSYYLLDAPAGYGKTELMAELKRRLREQGWVCACAPVSDHSSLLDVANTLAQELGIPLRLDPDTRQLGENLASALNRQRRENITQQGVALLIDLSKGPSFPIGDLLDEFIPGIQTGLRILEFFATKYNRFRAVIAGRFLASREEVVSATLPLKVLKLTPFDYDVVRDTAGNYLVGHSESSIGQISAHVTHLTGGHPGCMARMLEMYRESGLSPDGFLTSYAEDIQSVVLREVENIRNDIRPELRRTLDDLSVFRYLDYGLLRRLISGDAPLIQGYESEYDLADKLTGTYLLDWKGRLLRDDTTRRLLAIRLRQEVGMEAFSARCRQAQALCADHLREPTIQMPEMWAIEFMYQFLQQYAEIIQTPQGRQEIRQSFFGETVPNALRLLVSNRNAKVEQNALKRALDTDWEFRFTVNYFLRQDEYGDEPYRELQRRIDEFLDDLRG